MNRLNVSTRRHTEFVNIDELIQKAVDDSGVRDGVVQVYIPHTTAGVTINENADPDVVADIATALDRAVPWQTCYAHSEGNAAAHVKACMMGFSLFLFIENGRLALGTWQSVYLCEFDGPRTRQVWLRIQPDKLPPVEESPSRE